VNENLLTLDQIIHKEADEILYTKGLDDVLSQFGIPHYTGSYALQLMTWRDLDIYLEADNLSEEKFFELGSLIAGSFNPVKMSFRNERIAKTPGLPVGLYWGIYLGDERNGAWKIDIWAMDPKECQQRIEYCINLSNQISESARLIILDIKSKCWKDPAYRRSYLSTDIYKAVLEDGVRDLEGFRKWLQQ
jgi:hypothetical protein